MEPQKLGFIDSLRGFAALYVLVFHFSLITTPAAVAPRWLAPFTGLGGSGVTLFFVVSAFTLCLSSDSRRRDEGTPLRNFYIRRFFRIAPLFYVWIVLYCIRDKVIFDVLHSPAEIARSVFFVLNFFPGHEQGFVWASWTLGVEMLFYLAFPLFFKLASNFGRAVAMFLVSLLCRWVWHYVILMLVVDQSVASTYYNFSLLHHIPTFFLGIVAYRLYSILDMNRARQHGVGELLIAAGLFGLLAIAYGMINTEQVDGITVQAVIYGVLLIGLAIKAPGWFVNPVTRFYGKISYSVYLSHATTLFLMSSVFGFIYRRLTYVTFAYAVSLVIGLAVVTLISYVTYRFVETPGNNAGRILIRLLRRTVAV
ncbi:acyltransferase [Paraburkholderia acidicola]|uniref:Acyltransferase n=1 Tax=Paraburkholderia acidicola TaxID=1912599 RepID=A0A2A4EYJ9_9BURK|nr:acyltransferase [Paraburkholderia acidicola]PCE25226.1 acyltransferase [Paraburkholderia acidicola]